MNFLKLLNIIFTELLQATASVFIERIFNQCRFSLNKIYVKVGITSLLIPQNLFPGVAKES